MARERGEVQWPRHFRTSFEGREAVTHVRAPAQTAELPRRWAQSGPSVGDWDLLTGVTTPTTRRVDKSWLKGCVSCPSCHHLHFCSPRSTRLSPRLYQARLPQFSSP